MTVKIFKAGNSKVMTVPQLLLREWGVDVGGKLEIEKAPDSDVAVISPVKKKPKSGALTAEFKRWLDEVLEEDAELLDRLA